MITLDLVEYIKSQLNKNISKQSIITNLSEVGWKVEDIEEGFGRIEKDTPAQEIKEEKAVEKEEVKKFDPYREIPEGESSPAKEIIKEDTPSTLESLKIWVPSSVTPKIEEIKEVAKEEDKEEPTPQKTGIEPFKFEMGKGTQAFSQAMPITPAPIIPSQPIIKEASSIDLNILPKVESAKIESKIELTSEPKIEPIIPKAEVKQQIETPIGEFIPTLNKAPIINSVIKETPSVTQAPPVIQPLPATPSPLKVFSEIKRPSILATSPINMSGIVPKNAMLSSYNQDILLSSKKEEVNGLQKNRSFLKWGIGIIALAIIGGMIFAFVEGYLKFPGSKFSFAVVKKDPKTIILNAPQNISLLKSYKVDTIVNISSPSLSNITIGLSSGEAVASDDKDSLTLNSKGLVNHSNEGLIFDYLLNLKGTTFVNEIVSGIKYDGSQLAITVPDLNDFIGSSAPSPATVILVPNQLGLITPELPMNMQSLIKKLDIYDIASKGVPLYVENEISSIFSNFINSLNYSEKEEDTIRGVKTYHYELTADRVATKKLLGSLSDLFIMDLTENQKKNLDEALGSSVITSMDVWVGENDDNIYQFKFAIKAPLSKMIGVNDSGIANNEVNLDWATTYYDLDVTNNISMPTEKITIDEFINNIKDIKIKNIISSFKPQATMLKNAIGNYGKINTLGSCSAPVSGSLFSPLGHSKGANTAVSAISNSMNTLLLATNSNASCYSNSKAWALSAPLFNKVAQSDPQTSNDTYYCADSTGLITTLATPILGAVCK